MRRQSVQGKPGGDETARAEPNKTPQGFKNEGLVRGGGGGGGGFRWRARR